MSRAQSFLVTVLVVLLLLLLMTMSLEVNGQPTVADDGDDQSCQSAEFDQALNRIGNDVANTKSIGSRLEEAVNFIRKDVGDAKNLSSTLDEIVRLVRSNANDIKVIKEDLTNMKNFLGVPPPLNGSAIDQSNSCEYIYCDSLFVHVCARACV